MTQQDRTGRTNAVLIAEEYEDTADMDVAPPAYGEYHDQLQLSQAGFAAEAAVTDTGRITININQKNRRLSELLAPTLHQRLQADLTTAPAGPLPPAYIPPSLGGQPGQTPPPQLNVVMQIVGSRGDVQPFVALGQVLRDTYGHRVRIATHPTFQKFVEENGLEFFSIGGDPAELMAFMVKNPGLMPGFDALKTGEIKKRRLCVQEMLMGCWRSCIEAGNGLGIAPPPQRPGEPVDSRYILPGDPTNRPFVADAIIANPPSFAHVHIAEKLGLPLHMMFTMPWSPTRAFPHPLADIASTNTDDVMTNYVSYALVEMLTWQGLGDVINKFRENILDLEPVSSIWAPGMLTRLRIPTTYCWSPALIPKPTDWAPEISISGFYFLDLGSSYTPDPELAAFLDAGPPPVYIGFGSIVVDDPDALTRMIFEAIARTGVRALVSKGWGGIGADAVGLPDGVFMLGNCPHDWLFKRVSAVVHHGGAGTTSAGIKAGKPTVVVPFFGDQIFWGSMIARAGAGPAPLPYKKLTAASLAAAIQEAIKPETQTRAQELGARIREEKGTDMGGKSFHEFLNTDNMRCSLAPSRVAVWRVRRTQIRLSALAATVLVKEGMLKYSDLKLYRPVEYNTEDQPHDPISAVTVALLGDVSALTMAVADFPREIFRGANKKRAGSKAEVPDASPGMGAQASASTSTLALAPGDSVTSQPYLGTEAATSGAESAPNLSTQASESQVALLSHPLSSTSAPPSQPTPDSETPAPASPPKSTGPAPLEAAVGAGRGVANIVGAGMKMPKSFCLSLARGFRNAPKLYNDDTVRPTEKVTGIASGMRVAGKEFGLGLYDGISGLVMQPIRGAEKEGAKGLLKGFGKGIGGAFLKPASALVSLPAYTMQGAHMEIRNRFAKTSSNYIVTSRVLQGEEDLANSTAEERRDVVARWPTYKADLKGYYSLKQREKKSSGDLASGSGSGSVDEGPLTRQLDTEGHDGRVDAHGETDSPSTQGWFRGMMDERRNRVPAQRELRRREVPPPRPRTQTAGSMGSMGSNGGSSGAPSFWDDDAELERAILASVEQTSRGDREEDARIEAAIRASVGAMRRRAGSTSSMPWQDTFPPEKVSARVLEPEDERKQWAITDEEYQALVEEALKQSLEAEPEMKTWQEEGVHELPAGVHELPADDVEIDNVRSSSAVAAAEEEDMRRAMEESERFEREQRERMERERTEEEIVLEFVKKQSLAEEEYRRKMNKGKVVEEGAEAEDEDLKRALEESLRMGGGAAGSSSRS